MTDKTTPREQYEKATPSPLDYDTQPEPLEGTSPVVTLIISIWLGGLILVIAALIGMIK